MYVRVCVIHTCVNHTLERTVKRPELTHPSVSFGPMFFFPMNGANADDDDDQEARRFNALSLTHTENGQAHHGSWGPSGFFLWGGFNFL